MISVAGRVMQDSGLAVQYAYDCIHTAIVVHVADREAAVIVSLLGSTGFSGDILKTSSSKIPEDADRLLGLTRRIHGNVVLDVRSRDHQVLPPIVIKVDDSVRPPGHLERVSP